MAARCAQQGSQPTIHSPPSDRSQTRPHAASRSSTSHQPTGERWVKGVQVRLCTPPCRGHRACAGAHAPCSCTSPPVQCGNTSYDTTSVVWSGLVRSGSPRAHAAVAAVSQHTHMPTGVNGAHMLLLPTTPNKGAAGVSVVHVRAVQGTHDMALSNRHGLQQAREPTSRKVATACCGCCALQTIGGAPVNQPSTTACTACTAATGRWGSTKGGSRPAAGPSPCCLHRLQLTVHSTASRCHSCWGCRPASMRHTSVHVCRRRRRLLT